MARECPQNRINDSILQLMIRCIQIHNTQISVIKAAEGFDASKDAPAAALAAETAEAIQKLEDSYK